MNSNRRLVEALVNSKIYQEYERAFNHATGLPLSLRPTESWQLPHHNRRNENPFCRLMAGQNRTCALCLEVQQQLGEKAVHGATTMDCPTGLCDTAVPVKLGDEVIAFLQTGQVFVRKPSPALLQKTVRMLRDWGVSFDEEELGTAWRQSKVFSDREYQSIAKLLEIFADHLSMVSNQIAVSQDKAEPAVIAKAKTYIQDNLQEELSLPQVARAVSTSTFYFCKLFKKVTGLNFTDYVSRLRIEQSKNLLLNPNLRVSEIAYEVGFQSLTHFNRVFKRIVGSSPTRYREKLRQK